MALLKELENRYGDAFRGRQRGSLFLNVLTFCNFLRDLGLAVTLGRMIDVYRSLEIIEVTNREEFYYALKSNLVSGRDEGEIFDKAFSVFWALLKEEDKLPEEIEDELQRQLDSQEKKKEEEDSDAEEEIELKEWLKEKPEDEEAEEKELASYSPWEVLRNKDFASFQGDEIRLVRKAVRKIATRLATKLSLRKVPDPKSRKLDLRRTFRKNIRYGGEVVELAHRRRKVRKTRLVLICDVSGSMDCYSSFLIQFMYGLQNELSGVETFVFSTRLTRITRLLRGRNIDHALREISSLVHDWSGGTNIGQCLKTFNDWLGKDILNPRAVAIILSDGWDRGDPALLSGEMRRLRSNCYKLIWLNPLLGSSNYQPLCQGMKAAIPFNDYFLPAHNLQSLMALGRLIKPLVSRQ